MEIFERQNWATKFGLVLLVLGSSLGCWTTDQQVTAQFARFPGSPNVPPAGQYADARMNFSGSGMNAPVQPATGRWHVAETKNFTVRALDANLANQVAFQAEQYRAKLAVEWLGEVLPDWGDKCPITVEVAPQSGGETSFVFVGPPQNRQPTEWSMKIFGPPNRLLDAVLPHEITHTIFATHFGRPLPRWADEGACTTVEHESERRKIQGLLIEYLSAKPTKGIPFNRLFVMMQYPEEMLPLYAQSYSLARFLVIQKGRQHFVRYVGAAINQQQHASDTTSWDRMTDEYYGFRDLSELQVAWVKWVKAGSPEEALPSVVAVANNLGEKNTDSLVSAGPATNQVSSSGLTRPAVELAQAAGGGGGRSWYRQQMHASTSAGSGLMNASDPTRLPNWPESRDAVQKTVQANFMAMPLRTNSEESGEDNSYRRDELISGELARPLFQGEWGKASGNEGIKNDSRRESPRLSNPLEQDKIDEGNSTTRWR
jgi:hypothetical protein